MKLNVKRWNKSRVTEFELEEADNSQLKTTGVQSQHQDSSSIGLQPVSPPCITIESHSCRYPAGIRNSQLTLIVRSCCPFVINTLILGKSVAEGPLCSMTALIEFWKDKFQ